MRFEDVEKEMPDLLDEMMVDLRTSGCDSVREFFVVEDRSAEIAEAGGPLRFTYYRSDHPRLEGKLAMLFASGCVRPVTSNGAPIYRMTKEFVAYLLDGWPERRWPERPTAVPRPVSA